MSQNKKKNSFYYFMQKRKPELVAAGESFPRGLRDVSIRVSEEWNHMTSEEKKRYDLDNKGSNKMVPTPAIDLDKDDLFPVTQSEPMDVFLKKNISYLLYSTSAHIKEMVFILIDFNAWFRNDEGNYVPAEIGMVAFSLLKGVIDQYGALVDLENIPVGSRGKVSETRDEFYLPDPPFFEVSDDNKDSDDTDSENELDFHVPKSLIHDIFVFMNKYSDHINSGYLFCREERTPIVNGCLDFLLKKEDSAIDYHLEVYSFEDLIMKLSAMDAPLSSTKSDTPSSSSSAQETSQQRLPAENKKRIFTTKAQVDEILDSMVFGGNIHFGCFHHMEVCDVVHKCALAKLNRYAYNAIGALVDNFGIEKIHSVHFPHPEFATFETNQRTEMLNNWGLEKIHYPTFISPEERKRKHDAEMAELRLQDADVHPDDLPLPFVAPLFRPRQPAPTFRIVKSSVNCWKPREPKPHDDQDE